MTTRPVSDQHPGARRIGYLVAIVVNLILLYLVNVTPGWRVLPFLTGDFVDVLWLVNLSMVASSAANAAYLGYDPPRFKSVCQIGISAIGLATAIRMWQVFPFDFSAYSFNWAGLTRVLLALGIVGSIVAIVTELVRLAKRGFANHGVSAGPTARSPDGEGGQLRGSGS